MQSKRNSPRAM